MECRDQLSVHEPGVTGRGETAVITDTFLDGSRAALRIDGHLSETWAWGRNGKSDNLTFRVRLNEHGVHKISVGRQAVEVTVEPQSG